MVMLLSLSMIAAYDSENDNEDYDAYDNEDDVNVTAHEDLWWACIVTSGALTFLVLAASLVTLSFLMAPVIERVFGRTGCEPRPFPVANPFHHATSLNASLRLSHDCLPASFLSKYLSSSPPPHLLFVFLFPFQTFLYSSPPEPSEP